MVRFWARSIQPKFQPGKVVHLKRWTRFFETFPVGPNRSIEFWIEISGNFGRMDRTQFFPRSNAWELNTNLIPRAYSPFKMADWTQAKITARYKKVVSTVFLFISLSLYGTSIPRKYSIFIQQLNLFHFREIFPKNLQKPVRLGALSWDREKWQKIARLTAEPWELAGLRTVFCETSS